eukprot:9483124-Pyramimonas_sp.AAC.1
MARERMGGRMQRAPRTEADDDGMEGEEETTARTPNSLPRIVHPKQFIINPGQFTPDSGEKKEDWSPNSSPHRVYPGQFTLNSLPQTLHPQNLAILT